MADARIRITTGEVPHDQQLADARASLATARDLRDQASAALDAATAAYETARRNDPAGQTTDQARHAWAQALADYTDARVRVEEARDELAALHRQSAGGDLPAHRTVHLEDQ